VVRSLWFVASGAVLLVMPFALSRFGLDLACQVFIACIGSLALMLLTGFAGQISLGHAGLLAAGALTTGILFQETGAPFWITIPAAIAIGALLGFVFGMPSLRLRGIYLAVSTIAMHFIVIYVGSEYENTRGLSSGVVVDPPSLAGVALTDGRAWYYLLLAVAVLVYLLFGNLIRTRTGRAWSAIRARDTVAIALGINIAHYKLLAFVISSAVTAMAGALLTYYRGFVSSEAFSLDLTIQYVAMIIIGGIGSQMGAIFGAVFVTLLPYGIERAMTMLTGGQGDASWTFSVNYAIFGIVMCAFLLFEPRGIVGIVRRLSKWPGRTRRPAAELRTLSDG
jgi:branched-chain amino acid transport system permease protein